MAYLMTRHEKKEGNNIPWHCRKCSRVVTTIYEYYQENKVRYGRCRECCPAEFINQRYDEQHGLLLRDESIHTDTIHYGIDYMVAELKRIATYGLDPHTRVMVDIVRKLRPFLSPPHDN